MIFCDEMANINNGIFTTFNLFSLMASSCGYLSKLTTPFAPFKISYFLNICKYRIIERVILNGTWAIFREILLKVGFKLVGSRILNMFFFNFYQYIFD